MTGTSLRNVLGHAKRLRIARCAAEPLCVLTLLFGKVFFRIHFALGLEGLPVPIERKSGLDPCLVGPPYGLELPLAPLQHRDVLLAGAQYGRRPHLADLRRAPGRHELRGVLDLSPSGAVVSSDLAVLIAEVRAFTAPERAASMQRTPSTHPSWLLGVPSLEPDIAARAALSASASSHFPCPGRLLCILAGESASRTGIPSDARCLVRPAP